MSRILNSTLSAAVALLFVTGTSLMAADEHKHDHGKAVEVGAVTVGTTKVNVEMSGVATPGKEAHLELHLTPPAPAPKAIRVWIGIESGRGSEKAKAEGEAAHPGGYEAHVAVPSPLPEGSKIWISIEPASGDAVKGSLALPAAGAKPAAEHNHDHDKK
jgi:hypothetical protein